MSEPENPPPPDPNPGGGMPPEDRPPQDLPPQELPPRYSPLFDPVPGGPDILREAEDEPVTEETFETLGLPDRNTTDEQVTLSPHEEKAVVLPIYIFTAIFGAIFLIGPLLVRRGPNAGIARCCIMISAFCCWLFWTTMYIVQLNPLLGPRMGNETLAWIGHKWGKNPADIVDVENTSVKATARRFINDTPPLFSNLSAVVSDD
ncbi:hypothetical protein PYW07_017295 [Mythimna separata]|uniref:Uncharacterized protein n=1 Tax=Mythimna separata TaxID=271217 RepID=A0AAD7YV21_MYTSE|nr:hypothetical protein PYW07_017295 [Mythimna separata]